jgi:hypothetical protein
MGAGAAPRLFRLVIFCSCCTAPLSFAPFFISNLSRFGLALRRT